MGETMKGGRASDLGCSLMEMDEQGVTGVN